MFRRSAAINMPGVILSQFEMHTSASAVCALHMYSTLSAMMSRDGSEYRLPSWPIAMPSSTAIVLNSLPTPPAFAIRSEEQPAELQSLLSIVYPVFRLTQKPAHQQAKH